MPTLILVRHGRTTANASGILAGRLPGVRLDEVGQAQAIEAGKRLADVDLAEVIVSPQERCGQTAELLLQEIQATPVRGVDASFAECDYGDWQGRSLTELSQEPLWGTVQSQPSAVLFPGGETMGAMQARAVAAVRTHDDRIRGQYGDHAVWAVVSHGDVIKAILADAVGTHLDLFQRINVDPASISVVRYTGARPYLLTTNSHAGDLRWLNPPAHAERSDDAAVGGGAGPSEGDA